MRQFAGCTWLCLTLTFVGCASFPKLASNKPKKPTSTVGSAEFTSSNKLKNPAKLHLAYGGWHEQAGDYQEARQSYQKVLEKNPKDLEAILGLARIDQVYERYDECNEHLETARKYHPKDPRVFVAKGRMHAARGEWSLAVEEMRTAQKLAPFDPIYDYHLAEAEARSGDYTAALDHFTRSVGPAEAHFNVGYILNEQGRTAEAETHLKKALKLKPDLKQAQTTLAEMQAARATDVLPASFKKDQRQVIEQF